jgi:hypothetical protein
MSRNDTSTGSGGIGFCGLLTVLFVGLKLTGYIGWPWVWVISPLWIPLALVLALAAIAGIVYLFVSGK